MKISIFAKPLKSDSSAVRGYQIAEAIGAKLNPKKSYKNDLCIYVKPDPDPKGKFKFEGKNTYLDILDDWNQVLRLRANPEIAAIACSERDYVGLVSGLPNKVVLIPQHHCNFDREIRTRSEVKTLGVVGSPRIISLLPKVLRPQLEKRGLKLLELSDSSRRQNVVEFYKNIDLQIVWKPFRKKLGNPSEIINAASFGIPTIALDEIFFKELGYSYLGATSFNEFLVYLDMIRSSKVLYAAYSELCLQKAEAYHINKIAKLYKNLS